MAWPIPQPGQCPKPSRLEMHKELSAWFSERKNKAVNAEIQHNSSKWLRTHLKRTIKQLNKFFINH